MISPDVATSLVLIACAGAITLGGIHYIAGVKEVLPRLGPRFEDENYLRFFCLDVVVWDHAMPRTARRHYMIFLLYMCIAFACMLGGGLLRRSLPNIFITGGLFLACSLHMLVRWLQHRERLR
jgi:hypothetical protein